jgi:Tfp pilus assembly protein PilF
MRRALLAFVALAISACAPLPARDRADNGEASGAAGAPSAPRGSSDASPSASTVLLQQSRSQLATGHYPQAAASIERALRIEPDNAYLWAELAQIHLAEGNVQQAEAHARKAMSLAVNDMAARGAAQRVLDAVADR